MTYTAYTAYTAYTVYTTDTVDAPGFDVLYKRCWGGI